MLTSLETSIIDSMKVAFFENHKVDFGSNDAFIKEVTILNFFGEYDGSFAVQMTTTFMEYGDDSFVGSIADIAWMLEVNKEIASQQR